MFKIDQLKKTLSNLHFPDKDALRGTKLAPLTKTYDAYPIMHEGMRLCVLVNKGNSPQAVSRLVEAQTATQVVVLRQETDRWVKIWPNAQTAADAPTQAAAPAPAAQEPAKPGSMDFEIIEE